MADHHQTRDASPRRTHRPELGRPLTSGNFGPPQWGEEYRTFHVTVWTEVRARAETGGIFVLNVKDHISGGVLQEVSKWHP